MLGHSRALPGPALHFGADLAHFCGPLCSVEMGAAGACTSPGCTSFPRGAEAISSPALLGCHCVIPVHAGTGVGQGTGSPAAFPDSCQRAEPASNHSSSLDRQLDMLGKSICDSWVQEATGRYFHTTGCSSAVQQVLQDGKVQKTQGTSKFSRDTSTFISRDGVWEAGN